MHNKIFNDFDPDDFRVDIYRANVRTHPNADRLDIVSIEDYQIVTRKDSVKDGEPVAYIPIDSILPYELIEKLGLPGRLYGTYKNRVRSKRIRGILSEGLIYAIDRPIGTDVKDELGIFRYRQIDYSEQFNGRGDIPQYAKYVPGKTISFRIKNIKKKPRLFKEDDNVIITEKIHGRSQCIGMYEDESIITDKRLAWRDLVFIDNKYNADNVKLQMGKKLLPIVKRIQRQINEPIVYLLGELYGRGCQSMTYDKTEPCFAAYDIFIGNPDEGYYVPFDKMVELIDNAVEYVPVLYRGSYSRKIVNELTYGKSTLCDDIREGCVVKLDNENNDRLLVKSVAEEFVERLHRGKFSDYE